MVSVENFTAPAHTCLYRSVAVIGKGFRILRRPHLINHSDRVD